MSQILSQTYKNNVYRSSLDRIESVLLNICAHGRTMGQRSHIFIGNFDHSHIDTLDH